MLYGLDTSFLVALEIAEHGDHVAARQTLERIVQAGDRIALAPQVLTEFIHVVTDGRRFKHPLSMDTARQVALSWWGAKEVDHVFNDDAVVQEFLSWLLQFSLGRKRLLDTLLAATFHRAGIQSILTANPADFSVFGLFNCLTPGD